LIVTGFLQELWDSLIVEYASGAEFKITYLSPPTPGQGSKNRGEKHRRVLRNFFEFYPCRGNFHCCILSKVLEVVDVLIDE
jgi:hypothetical protein